MLAEHFDGNGPEFWRQACALSLEGVISKRADRPYIGGRSRDWIKVKCALRQEFVVVGFTAPSGSRTGFGALLLAVTEDDGLRYAGRVGTGFSDAALRELRSKLDTLVAEQPPVEPPKGVRLGDITWVRPELIAEVRFREWTREGVARQASFAGLREDAAATDVVHEKPATRITNPDKVLWAPASDGSSRSGSAPVTKADVVAYYESIAEHILAALAGRPLTLVRCPHGLSSECFYQKHPDPRGFPESLDTFRITEHGKERTYLHVESLEGLIDLVQLGTLELHAWNSLVGDPERPDRIIFDLDPGPGISWVDVCRAGHDLRTALAALGLTAWPKTTGGHGLHLVVPIVPQRTYDEVRALSRAFVDTLAAHEPNRFTARMAKREREGRIFIDYLRNAHGATAVVAYSTRARAGIPVAVPIAWEELTPALDPAAFDIRTVPARSNAPGFRPWNGYEAARVELEDALFTALDVPAGSRR
jgi:bifunctional non-homologous end joining protein LigD